MRASASIVLPRFSNEKKRTSPAETAKYDAVGNQDRDPDRIAFGRAEQDDRNDGREKSRYDTMKYWCIPPIDSGYQSCDEVNRIRGDIEHGHDRRSVFRTFGEGPCRKQKQDVKNCEDHERNDDCAQFEGKTRLQLRHLTLAISGGAQLARRLPWLQAT